MGGLWVVDDEPSVRFPIYTRGNTGEVYPNVITPLCGSVVKDPIARGQARVFAEMGAVLPSDLTEDGHGVFTGCFGGYLYGNLSIGRLMGARAPGMKPEDVDTQMFGTSDAPPYRRQPGDRNLRSSLRMAAFMTRMLRSPDLGWLRTERAEVQAWAASRPSPERAGDAELLETVDEGSARFGPLMRSLLLASMHGGVAAATIDRLTAKADPEARAKIAVGVGEVESAGPAGALWGLAQIEEGTPAFALALEQFVARFGSRGPDEWELASHTWGTDPSIALAAVDRMRGAGIPDPAVVLARLAEERAAAVAAVASSVPRPARGVFRRAARMVGEGAAAREFAKGTIIEAAYAVRRALFELVRRAQDNGGPEDRLDCWLVTRAELPAFVNRPAAFADVVAERRAQRDLLQSRVPPFVFEGRIPDPSTWERRDAAAGGAAATAGEVLAGIAVSPGRARGPARIVRDPSDPSALQPGDVLVAPITDPAWTPLFLVASAVVVEVGANLSHAAIVARELGIPAVVSVAAATTRLRSGSLLDVDGTAGTVTVVE